MLVITVEFVACVLNYHTQFNCSCDLIEKSLCNPRSQMASFDRAKAKTELPTHLSSFFPLSALRVVALQIEFKARGSSSAKLHPLSSALRAIAI